ncbi:MAG: hypothetical protein KA249_05780, partial [Dermatophilaceae bacterium]|nr:hypothetical protein [Dermatophilaceae bacterium]
MTRCPGSTSPPTRAVSRGRPSWRRATDGARHWTLTGTACPPTCRPSGLPKVHLGAQCPASTSGRSARVTSSAVRCARFTTTSSSEQVPRCHHDLRCAHRHLGDPAAGGSPSGRLTPVNPSQALSTVVVDELVRGGVREVVLCPGSRSAPLAYALVAAERAGHLRLHVRVDERSAGFLALGLARGSRMPVAIVT